MLYYVRVLIGCSLGGGRRCNLAVVPITMHAFGSCLPRQAYFWVGVWYVLICFQMAYGKVRQLRWQNAD